MKGKTAVKASPLPKPRMATPEEISRAIDELGLADLLRLNRYAINRISCIGPHAASGRTEDDLLQTAVERLMDGTRHWFPGKAGIVSCLIGAIRSIASAWAAFRRRNADSPEYAILEAELIKEGEDGEVLSPFDVLSTENASPNVEEQAIQAEIEAERKALADEIEASCADDDSASMVLLGWQSNMDGPAIKNEFGWTETEYRTTVKRIQRRAHQIAERHYGR